MRVERVCVCDYPLGSLRELKARSWNSKVPIPLLLTNAPGAVRLSSPLRPKLPNELLPVAASSGSHQGAHPSRPLRGAPVLLYSLPGQQAPMSD